MTDNTHGPGHNSGVDQVWLKGRLSELRKIGNTLLDNKKLKDAAGKTRSTWLAYGEVLADVREAIPSNKEFNVWLKENDLEAYADRNSRTDAMWMAKQSEDLIGLIPAELHSPKAIRNWYRKSLKEALVANSGDVDKALANPETADFAGAVNSGDWDVAVAAYEASKDKEKFEDTAAADAAKAILAKLAKHSTPYEVFSALKQLVDEGGLDAKPEQDAPAPSPEQDAPAPLPEQDDEWEDEYEGEEEEDENVA